MDLSAAVLTIHRAPDMTRRGAVAISKWLHRMADDIADHSKRATFARRLTCRYRYVPTPPRRAQPRTVKKGA